jgi:glycosyltransferase involved in cell wall biosynthesis
MIRACQRLGRRKQVKAFVSFNPFPYGLFSYLAAGRCGKPVHFGFMGSDWNLKMQRGWGRFLLRWVRQGEFITCTGPSMKKEMIERGLDENRIEILPHTIDLAQYPVADPAEADYASLFVGRLIRLKQVDVILKGWAKVLKKLPDARFAIIGDGPLKKDLLKLANDLGIQERVDFPGHIENVTNWYARAKTIVIASTLEGFPYVLVEAMATGLVPVSTPVGTIPDFIRDRENGLFFPVGEPEKLAECILSLLNNAKQYNDLRDNVLLQRDKFTVSRATAVWNRWLQTLS